MKKVIQSLWLLLLFTSMSALAQRTITGTVTNSKDGNPVEGASLYVVGTQIMQKTNDKGSFTIQIPQELTKKNIVVGVSAKGFKSEKVDASSDNLSITLDDNSQKVDEVIVTAQGIKRKKNTLPFAAQQVSGEEISNTRTNNFVSNLSGKAAGIEIRQSNTMGGSTNVVIRGNKSLTGNNQALFVVDGIPYFNSNFNDANQRTGRGGYDYGNTAADINPDDVENITVLKGAAASALYGSNASNGVVMITTKKVKSGKKGLGVNFQTGATFGFADRSTFLKYQKSYGAGYGKYYSSATNAYLDEYDPFNTGKDGYVAPTYEDASYGAMFDPNLNVYQWDAFDPTSANYKKATPWMAAANDPFSFLEMSTSLNNSIFVTGGNEGASFKLGYTRNDDWGILPNSKINKNAFNLSGSYQLMKNLTISANAQYTVTEGLGRYGTGYDSKNLMGNFRQWWETNVDLQAQKDAYFRTGKNATWNITSDNPTDNPYTPAYWDNPYWTRYQNYQNDKRNRVFGYAQMVYQPLSSLTVTGRASVDYYDFTQEERIAKGSIGGSILGTTSEQPSGYGKASSSNTSQNYDLITNFDKNLSSDLNFKALLGFNMRKTSFSSISQVTNGGIIVPNVYSFANSLSTPNAAAETQYSTQTNSVYGGFTFTYQDMLTLDATLRGDASSTLPVDNNVFLYPSVSAGFVFSKWKVFQNGFLNPKNTFGKLRLNYAEVGSAAPALSVLNTYNQNTSFGSSSSVSNPTTNNNPNLRPERSKSWEVGLEMSFANNRFGFDATYYNTKTVDQIMPVSISAATGFSRQYVNAGVVSNQGVELSLWAAPVRNSDWSWDVNLNWTKNKSLVEELYPGADNLQLAGYQGGVSVNATPGQAYGSIRGTDFVYLNGQKVISASTGRYLMTSTTNNVIGNATPNWLMGLQNKFSYKNFSASFLIDVRNGGDVFSLDMYYGLATGLPVETAYLNDLGNPVRNSLATGGGVILSGVTPDGNVNTKRVSAENYGLFGYVRNPAKAFVYDASYVKLREVVLTYKLPKRMLGKSFIKDASLSLFSRNLWIIYKNLPYADPEDMISSGNAQGYQTGSYPNVRTFGFNLKVGF